MKKKNNSDAMRIEVDPTYIHKLNRTTSGDQEAWRINTRREIKMCVLFDSEPSTIYDCTWAMTWKIQFALIATGRKMNRNEIFEFLIKIDAKIQEHFLDGAFYTLIQKGILSAPACNGAKVGLLTKKRSVGDKLAFQNLCQ